MREPTPPRLACRSGRVPPAGLAGMVVGLALLLGAAGIVIGRPGSAAAAPSSSPRPGSVASRVGTGAPAGVAANPAGTATLDAAPAAGSLAGMSEASRPDGTLGRWVVAALLLVVAAVWIALLAVVVRVRRAVGRAPTSS